MINGEVERFFAGCEIKKSGIALLLVVFITPLLFGQSSDGSGLVIAVPTPVFSNASSSDNWISQFVQDIITSGFARYSKMTVVDRRNEELAKSELQRAEDSAYSQDDFISIGRMTSAKYVAAGNITYAGGRFTLSLRVNEIETNEIKASFNQMFSRDEMESGHAARMAVLELLTGLGITLSDAAREDLRTKSENNQTRATAGLARGMSAERENRTVEAIANYIEAQNADSSLKEAMERIDGVFAPPPNATTRERMDYAVAQKERWDRIVKELTDYQKNHLILAIVMDLGELKDVKMDVNNKTVDYQLTGKGFKLVPDRTVLQVTQLIYERFLAIKDLPENKEWVRSSSASEKLSNKTLTTVRSRWSYFGSSSIIVTFGLYNEHGEMVQSNDQGLYSDSIDVRPNTQIKSQRQLYTDTKWFWFRVVGSSINRSSKPLAFNGVKIGDVTDAMSISINRIMDKESKMTLTPRIMTENEFDAWLAVQTPSVSLPGGVGWDGGVR
jgi:TolB-like protein